MSTPPTTTPANLAKAALRRLAEQRLEPTPDNFRKAYEAESGSTSEADSAPPAVAVPSQAPNQAEEGERWSKLIGRILRGAERGGRQWTSARKKDSLQRVLEGSKNSGQRLHQRHARQHLDGRCGRIAGIARINSTAGCRASVAPSHRTCTDHGTRIARLG